MLCVYLRTQAIYHSHNRAGSEEMALSLFTCNASPRLVDGVEFEARRRHVEAHRRQDH
jgi:hypothetical protein